MGVCLNHIFSDQLPLRALSEQVTVIPAGGKIEVGTGGWPKILYYYGGGVEMSLEDGTTYQISPGDILVLPGEVRQSYSAPGATTPVRFHALVLNFERREKPAQTRPSRHWDGGLETYLHDTFSKRLHLPSRSSYFLWELTTRIRNECEARRPMHHLVVCELARRLVFRIAEHAALHGGVKLPQKLALVEKACSAALEYPFAKPGKKTDGSTKKFGVSTSTLNRTFQQCLGTPYSRAIARIRIEHAKSYLLDSSLPVSRIARLFHFGSTSTFDRAFKAATGLTPKRYQQSYDGTPVQWSNIEMRNRGTPSGGKDTLPPCEKWSVHESCGTLPMEAPSLVLCLKGSCIVEVRGSEATFSEHDHTILLVAAGESITYRPSKPSVASALLILDGRALWNAFSGREGSAFLQTAQATINGGGFLPLRFLNGMDIQFLRGWVQSRDHGSHAALFIRSLCRTLWIEALRMASSGTITPSLLPPLMPAHRLLHNHARDFISKHYPQVLTLGDIAWAVGVSEEHLARTFRAESGTTVMGYLQEYRVLRAQVMLVKSCRTISEIAELSGFSTVPLFHRVFKRHTGQTPNDFRKKGIAALP